MKTCRVCNKEKELGLFKKANLQKDGRSSICKECHVQQTLEHRKTKHLKNENDKKCRRCKEVKSLDRFCTPSSNPNRTLNICRDCYNKDKRESVFKLNLEKYLESSKENQYALKTCKKHGKLSYCQIGLEIHKECDPIIAIMVCLDCKDENIRSKFNNDNLLINTTNSIIKCNRCLFKKSIFHFYPSELKRTKPTCRECLGTKSKRTARKSLLKSKYNITLDQYEGMLDSQNNVCKICHNPETHRYKKTNKITQLSVDHNHQTGAIRALLCRQCNIMIGNSRDSAEILRSAASYLEQYD